MTTPETTCAVEGCERLLHARGWCGTHYARWRRTGSTIPAPRDAKGCEAPECDRPHYSGGYCTLHYQRLRNFGTTELSMPTVGERLLASVTKEKGGCWLWRQSEGKNGYGRISVNNRLEYAHRVSYETFVGPIPEGLTIDHLCRVRMCINPDHLEPVTLAENNRRAAAAKRSAA